MARHPPPVSAAPAEGALRALADDPHLLRDLGLTREEALEEADKPFWR